MKKLKSVFTALTVLALVTGCGRNNVIPSSAGYFQNPGVMQPASSEFNAMGQSDKRIVLNFSKPLTASDINALEIKYKAKITRIIPQIGIAVAEPVAAPANVIQAASVIKSFSQTLKNDNLIDTTEPLSLVQLEKVKAVKINDPEAKDQYHVDLLELEKVWAINAGASKVKIAIIDTGVDLNHPDLKDKLLKGRNILKPGSSPMDDNGHGTHVAGIAAASTDNGIGVAGIAPKCSIIPVKVLDNGRGSDVDIAEGIVWAVDQGTDVINLSVGVYSYSSAMEKAVRYALRKGVVVVSSAGNSGKNSKIHYPSMIKGVIEVSATTKKDKFSDFSNFGQQVAVSAPGDEVLSTMPTYKVTLTSEAGKNYGVLSGTSMASPMVAGFAALLKSQDKNLTPAQIKAIIEENSSDLGSRGYDKYFGNGRIDIYKTMKKFN